MYILYFPLHVNGHCYSFIMHSSWDEAGDVSKEPSAEHTLLGDEPVGPCATSESSSNIT